MWKLIDGDLSYLGNNHMKEENYRCAVECYTKAIDLDLRNAVYYGNRYLQQADWLHTLLLYHRKLYSFTPDQVLVEGTVQLTLSLCRAAAHSKLGNYTEATGDCERAIAIDPMYSKAYGRMG